MKTMLVLIVLIMSAPLFARNEVGVGGMLGNPVAVNAKYWLDGDHAVDGAMGWSMGTKSNFMMYSDYLLHKKAAFYYNDVSPLDLYYGLGGRMEFADNFRLGARVPVGLAHRFKERPVDIFGELAPIFDFIGRFGVEVQAALGARYYF